MKISVILDGFVGAAAIAATVVLSPFLRGRYRRWGATDEEVRQVIPGDEFVPHPKSQLDMAVTVEAPAEAIWPWFLQLGCQRAGWYSYDLLDNGGIESAEQIIPEFQHLEVGEIVKNMPKGESGFPVALIKPGRQLTMAGTTNTETGEESEPDAPGLEKYFSGNQTFLLQEIDEGRTRLIFRMRIDWNETLLNNIAFKGVVEPLSFVMGRKTLLNVGRRAETMALALAR